MTSQIRGSFVVGAVALILQKSCIQRLFHQLGAVKAMLPGSRRIHVFVHGWDETSPRSKQQASSKFARFQPRQHHGQ